MTKRIKKNLNWLRALETCDKSEQRQLLAIAKPEKINALCDCIHNIINGAISISSKDKNKIQNKKNFLRKVVDKKTRVPARRKLLVQHGAGLFTALIAPTLLALGAKVLSR